MECLHDFGCVGMMNALLTGKNGRFRIKNPIAKKFSCRQLVKGITVGQGSQSELWGGNAAELRWEVKSDLAIDDLR